MGGVSFIALQDIYKGQQIRKELRIPLDAKVVLSVGEINKNKNHIIGIKALAKLKDPSIYYVICGRGSLLERLKKLAKEIKVEDKVIFAGYRTNVADFYRMADLFLFPSFREGLPVSLIEAMASGLPIIATKIRGINDLVEQDLLFTPMDVEGMTNAIEKMQLRKVKYEIAVFDLHKVVNLLKEVYKIGQNEE